MGSQKIASRKTKAAATAAHIPPNRSSSGETTLLSTPVTDFLFTVASHDVVSDDGATRYRRANGTAQIQRYSQT